MLAQIPIYVEARRSQGRAFHVCRPVVFPALSVSDALVGRALTRLRRRLKERLDDLGRKGRHDELTLAVSLMPVETRLVKSKIELRDRRAECRLLWLIYPALGRRIAHSPTLPELWFELVDGQEFEQRVDEVLGDFFRREERQKKSREPIARPEELSLPGQAWVTTIEIDVLTRQSKEDDFARQLAAIFGKDRQDGNVELQRVGRCLDWLQGDELLEGVGRQSEIERLDRLLESREARPVALIGPRQSGKTTVLHQVVRRRMARKGKERASRANIWLLSPQRLVSGMMYVGQWEGRLQAILRTARRRGHVLYFDDFLGLYQAGISRDSSLSMAEVLKPALLRQEVRVLAEMTPEAWHALQERDRGLADQFEVVRVEPMGEEETWRALFEIRRRVEAEHGVCFDLESLATMMQLQASYVRDAAFPGKVAAMAKRVGAKHARSTVTRQEALAEFHAQTGLSPTLIDDRRRLERSAVIQSLRRQIVGQDDAVETLADVVMLAKARLANPARPLATLLFLGPTGVGKTQCAKALAETLFGEAERLVRLDMNQHVTAHSAALLAGTVDQPEGLLTSAVRRQPFCVVLLDEIEKAHPDVFDLLLQALGEGRLTDAWGRTTDFTNAVFVMTSNLGSSAGRGRLGWGTESTAERDAYVRAAESFFRPEFVNRIDRIVAFQALERRQMKLIAEQVLARILSREGLTRRRCCLSIDDQTLERVADEGYHPLFGARALKRVLERQVAQPVAAALAATRVETPTVVRVHATSEGLRTEAYPLEPVDPAMPRWLDERSPREQLDLARRFLARIEREIAAARPVREPGQDRGVSPAEVRFYGWKEQLLAAQRAAAELEATLAAGRNSPSPLATAPKVAVGNVTPRNPSRLPPASRVLKELRVAQDIRDYLQETVAAAASPSLVQRRVAELLDEVAWLHSLWTSRDAEERVVLRVRPLVQGMREATERLCLSLALGAQELSYACQAWSSRDVDVGAAWGVLVLEGPGIEPIAGAELGTHLFCGRREPLAPILVERLAAPSGPIDEELARKMGRGESPWEYLWGSQNGSAVESQSSPSLRWVRLYDGDGPTLDLRTGRALAAYPQPSDWRRMVLAGLPLPAEFEVE